MAEIFALTIKRKDYSSGKTKLGSLGTRMEEAFKEVKDGGVVNYVRTLYFSSQSSGSVARRKGKLSQSVTFNYSRTAKDNVSGVLSIGKNVPYGGIHVGRRGDVEIMSSSKKMFTIPLPWNRKADGSWRAPFTPGTLASRKDVFRGSRKHNLNPNFLYQKFKTRGPKPIFKLQRTIAVPVRVDEDEIRDHLKEKLSIALVKAFEGYDFGYIRTGKR